MATKTNNGPKANPGEIKQALNFLKELLPHNLVKAIGILLHPCCQLEIVGLKITCSDKTPGNFNITFTVSNPVAYPDISASATNISGASAITISSDGKTITFKDANITSVPGTFVLALQYIIVRHSLIIARIGSIDVTSDDVPTC